MEKTELEKREKELKKVSLYERLSNEVSIEKQKEEIKEKIKTAVATNDFEEMIKEMIKELKAIETQVTKEEEEGEFLKVRETKRMLWNVIEMLPLRNIKMTIAGFTITIKPVSEKPIQSESGITIEKNKTVTKVSAVESLTAKVQRLSAINPNLHVTESDKKYPKPAKAWLVKNFGTVEV